MEAAESTDLVKWKSFASGVNGSNLLFDNLLDKEMHMTLRMIRSVILFKKAMTGEFDII